MSDRVKAWADALKVGDRVAWGRSRGAVTMLDGCINGALQIEVHWDGEGRAWHDEGEYEHWRTEAEADRDMGGDSDTAVIPAGALLEITAASKALELADWRLARAWWTPVPADALKRQQSWADAPRMETIPIPAGAIPAFRPWATQDAVPQTEPDRLAAFFHRSEHDAHEPLRWPREPEPEEWVCRSEADVPYAVARLVEGEEVRVDDRAMVNSHSRDTALDVVLRRWELLRDARLGSLVTRRVEAPTGLLSDAVYVRAR